MNKKDVKLRLDRLAWLTLRAEAARQNRPMAHVLLDALRPFLVRISRDLATDEKEAAVGFDRPAAA